MKVHDCGDCPLMGDAGYRCQHPNVDAEHRDEQLPCYVQDPAPAWCPLRAGTLEIEMEETRCAPGGAVAALHAAEWK
jgi:hypothetical protein